MPANTLVITGSNVTGISCSAHGLQLGQYLTIQDSGWSILNGGTFMVESGSGTTAYVISASTEGTSSTDYGYTRRLKFVDFINGFASGSAGDGTSFSRRRNDITSFAAAQLNGNDFIRICQSPTQSICNVSCSWQDGQNYVLIENSNNIVAEIDNCNAGWVSGSFSTGSTVSNASVVSRKLPGLCVKIDTTTNTSINNILAYKTLATPLNLGNYNAISFWYYNSTAASYSASIQLCSDTSGSIPLYNFVIPTIAATSTWLPVTIETSSYMLDGAVNSIAIKALAAPGSAKTVYYQNFFACVSTSSQTQPSNSLHLNSLIGKNDGEWYSVSGLNITSGSIISASLYSYNTETLNSGMPYSGSTEAVPLYTLNPITQLTAVSSAASNVSVNKAGVSHRYPIITSGGWDSVNMTTRPHYTWFNGIGQISTLFNISNAYCQYDNLGILRFLNFGYNVGTSGPTAGMYFNNCKFIGNSIAILISTYNKRDVIYTDCDFFYNRYCFNASTGYVTNVIINNCKFKSSLLGVFGTFDGDIVFDRNCIFGYNNAICYQAAGSLNNYQSGILSFNNVDFNTPPGNAETVFEEISGIVYLNNCAINATSDVAIRTNTRGKVISVKHNHTANNTIIWLDGGKSTSQNSICHTGTNYCPKIDLTGNHIYSDYKLIMPIGQLLTQGNKQVTASVYMLNNTASMITSLVLPGGQLSGSYTYDISSSLSNSSGSWVKQSVMFNPKEAGVFELEARAYDLNSATDASTYIADIEFTEV